MTSSNIKCNILLHNEFYACIYVMLCLQYFEIEEIVYVIHDMQIQRMQIYYIMYNRVAAM